MLHLSPHYQTKPIHDGAPQPLPQPLHDTFSPNLPRFIFLLQRDSEAKLAAQVALSKEAADKVGAWGQGAEV